MYIGARWKISNNNLDRNLNDDRNSTGKKRELLFVLERFRVVFEVLFHCVFRLFQGGLWLSAPCPANWMVKAVCVYVSGQQRVVVSGDEGVDQVAMVFEVEGQSTAGSMVFSLFGGAKEIEEGAAAALVAWRI